jgi:hypothetical protein
VGEAQLGYLVIAPALLEVRKPKWPIIPFTSPTLFSEREAVLVRVWCSQGVGDPNVFACHRNAIVNPTDIFLLPTARGVEVGNLLTHCLDSPNWVVVHAPFRVPKQLKGAAQE